ncbi:carbonic anhydrase/acetyltransferase-like protein (isoleucine patch superfamily) [Altererythrobacter atlanticus]|uniref:Carnitine operon protein CaiE n=1 Tax=Croceibacterium atlanticum TaxID=1267766 RepID=A0A0F7KTK1_9SPHN|nr:gamma carbonic anhydrase family protein [Croceibacterium atlanticum]AKH42130.1 Carnitine operon protein CaiE [Croceibacterium atlanticum]MBB5733299.1 carbonic anhydrase/acetyltransferase-like protein (isoleucine patch superfamily) [Croceibacterium atlanticum]
MHEHPGALILAHGGRSPRIPPGAFIAPGARIIGDVTIGEGASIWYNCVLRGDLAPIEVGARSNVQDGSVIHVEGPRKGGGGAIQPVIIGEDVLIGHMALLHGCRIESRGFVGMGAIVMDGACVQSTGMLGAGALLPPGKTVPEGELWTGRPARPRRALGPQEIAAMADQCDHYLEMAEHHRGLAAES